MADPSSERVDGVSAPTVSDDARRQAIAVAGVSIGAGLQGGDPVLPELDDLAPDLRRANPVFVTVLVRGELNGCIGSVTDEEAVGRAIAQHAWSAAFTDPRLPRLRPADADHVTVEVSVLSTFETVPGTTASDLASTVRRGVEGLLISSGTKRALFLPSVWSQLRSAEQFVDELFHKAGLDPTRDHPDLDASVFTTTKFGARVSGDVLGAG